MCESRFVSQGKTPESTKMGETHELSFWPFLWFAGATPECMFMVRLSIFRDGPNTVSGRTVSNTELSELFGPRRVGRELSELFSAFLFACQSELTEFFAELTEFVKTQ